MEWGRSPDPVMTVGKYAGVPVSKLPLSYCRWILMQSFPDDILEAAEKKVKASSFNNSSMTISRHALDMFSVRFLDYWLDSGQAAKQGIASYLAELAEEGWRDGKDVSKRRHQDDGIVKLLHDICFVFAQSKELPEYRELITMYPDPGSSRARRYPHPSRIEQEENEDYQQLED